MKSSIAICAILAVGGLAACQRSAAPANTVAASSASAASSVAASSAAPVSKTGETPTAFVTRMIAPYQPNGAQWTNTDTPAKEAAQKAFTTKYDADFYDPGFLAAINDNGTLAYKKAGGVDMDYDPICQCQDQSATYQVVSGHPDGAHYDVLMKSDDKEQGTWTFVLTDSDKGWRLYDILDQSGDVRKWLTQHNDCMRAAKTEDQGSKCVGG